MAWLAGTPGEYSLTTSLGREVSLALFARGDSQMKLGGHEKILNGEKKVNRD